MSRLIAYVPNEWKHFKVTTNQACKELVREWNYVYLTWVFSSYSNNNNLNKPSNMNMDNKTSTRVKIEYHYHNMQLPFHREMKS